MNADNNKYGVGDNVDNNNDDDSIQQLYHINHLDTVD